MRHVARDLPQRGGRVRRVEGAVFQELAGDPDRDRAIKLRIQAGNQRRTDEKNASSWTGWLSSWMPGSWSYEGPTDEAEDDDGGGPVGYGSSELATGEGGGSVAEVAVVGDFDPAQVKSDLEKLFGSWSSLANNPQDAGARGSPIGALRAGGAVQVGRVPAGQRDLLDVLARHRCVDQVAAADVHADVALTGEVQQVTRLELGGRHVR